MHFASPIDVTSDLLDDETGVPQNPGTLLDLMCVEVANLLATTNYSPSGNTGTETASILLTRAQAVDARLATWPQFIPQTWTPTQVSISNVPKTVITTGFYGKICDIYPDIMVCSTWNEWRVARLMILGFIASLNVNNNNEDHNNIKEAKHRAIATIQELVDGICASIPFSLGDRTELGNLYEARIQYPSLPDRPVSKAHQKTAGAYGGWYMFAPLKETLKVGMHLRKGQHEWLVGQLWRLAKMYGVTPE